MKKIILALTAIVSFFYFVQSQNCTNCDGSTISNNGSAIGNYVTASSNSNFVIGTGVGSGINERLVNNKYRSLLIGFGSTKPTFFVSDSPDDNKTGKIGIGDVTDPQAKLHIKADNNEDADLLLEPGSSMNYARVKFGTAGNRIDARGSQDLNFHTASDFVFWDANVGIGTHNPTAKLEITNGDIFISDIDHGIIMKSPDGQCWRGTVDNGGTLNFTAIDCNQLTITDNYSEPDGLKVTVYPNPSKDVITVKAEGTCADLSVTLKDINGSTVLTREIRNGKIKIRTAELPTGTYIVNIKSDGGECVHSEKVIIN